MNIHITARHFKASQNLHDFIEASVQSLGTRFDGIVKADITLENGHAANTGNKSAEIILSVYHETLVAKETSEMLEKSVQLCVEKLERQLVKYKDRLRAARHPNEGKKAITDEVLREGTDLAPDVQITL